MYFVPSHTHYLLQFLVLATKAKSIENQLFFRFYFCAFERTKYPIFFCDGVSVSASQRRLHKSTLHFFFVPPFSINPPTIHSYGFGISYFLTSLV